MGELVDLDKFRKAKENGDISEFKKLEVHEFTMDMDGLEKLAEKENMDLDRLINILPSELVGEIFGKVSEDIKIDDKVSDVHDACFEVQLLAEQYPKHAGFIEKQVQFLVRQLILYINNSEGNK
jgi:hypothetical protein